MILKSVNMTGTEMGQLWYGVALAGRENGLARVPQRNAYR